MAKVWQAETIEVYKLPVDRVSPHWDSVDNDTRIAFALQLQQRFDVLLSLDASLTDYVRRMQALDLKAVVFGGWARDRIFELIRGRPCPSRDIDMVVQGPVSVAKALPESAIENPFGGFGVEATHLHFDAWDLPNTFLIRRNTLPVSFEQLPFTADYNVNAVVFKPTQFFSRVDLVDAGAVNSMRRGVLDFAADDIALPLVQAARSVILAARLELELSDTVRTYLRSVCRTDDERQSVIGGINIYCPDEWKNAAVSCFKSIVESDE